MPPLSENQRQFLYSVLASLLATVIWFAIPQTAKLLRRNGAYLDVGIAGETVGNLSTLRMEAVNSGDYALDPVQFHANLHGKILHIGMSDPSGNTIAIDPGSRVDPAWTGVLGKNEKIVILVVGEGPIEAPDISKIFSGSSIVLGQRGVVEKGTFVVRSTSDVATARYVQAAKVLVFLVSSIFIGWLALFLRKKRQRPKQPLKPLPQGN